MIKVLHYVDENNLTWARSWIELLKCLEKRNISNTVICRPGGTLGSLLESNGIPHFECRPMISSLPVSFTSFGRHIRAIRPHILHTRLSSAAFIGGWWGRKLGIPTIASLDKFAKLKYYKNIDILLPCSSGVRDDIVANGFAKERAFVVYNSLDYNKYLRNEIERSAFRQKLNIADDEIVICAAGRFDAGKGFPILLNAFKEVAALRPMRLILLGDGPQKAELNMSAQRYGLSEMVEMPGFVSDIRPWLWASDIFVFPSDGPDAFGMSLLEAMAAGNAPIATDCGGPQEIITGTAEGLIVPRASVESLAKALRCYIGHPDARHAAVAGAVKRAACFDIRATADKIIEIYNNAVKQGA